MNRFIARQPIFDGSRRTVAYELLFRTGLSNAFPGIDGTVASRRLMHDGLHLFGLERLTSGKPAYINCTREFLLDDMIRMLPPQGVVLEILETVAPDREVIEACRSLRADGYVIALDDFVFAPEFEPLLRLADVVKVDFLATQGAERRRLVERCKPRGTKLLAEKVETAAEFAEGAALGYTLFQGYFFSRPEILQERDLPANKLQLLRLLAAVNVSDIDIDKVEQIVKQDVSVTIKLLRYLSSAAAGGRREIGSIRHALIMLGGRTLRQWVSLLVVSSLGDAAPEVVTTSLVRARFGELVATHSRLDASAAFLAGLLSMLDVMLGRPLAECLELVSAAPAVRAALQGVDCPLARIGEMVIAYERGDWGELAATAALLGLDQQTVLEAYESAVVWAQEVVSETR